MQKLRQLGRADLLAAFGVLCLCTTAVWSHMQSFPEVSPFDEATHIDYVFTMASLELPALGTPYDERVLSEWSCRGSYSDQVVLPPCTDASFDYSVYPGRGIQRNPTGPIYYGIVAALSQPFASAFDSSPLGAARLTGALFLWLSALLTVAGARMLGTSRAMAWGVAACIPIGMPLVLHATSTVNSDAGTMLIGALILPLALRADISDAKWRWSVLILAAIAGFTKQTALFPIGTLAVTIAARGLWTKSSTASVRSALITAGAACFSALVALGVWTAIVEVRTLDGFENPIGMGNTVSTSGNPLDEALTGLAANVPPTSVGYVPPALRTPFQPTTGKILALVFLASLGAAFISTDVIRRSLAWGVLAGSVASALLIQAYLAFGEDRFFQAPNARYAIGLIPASLVLVAVFFDSRRELRVAGYSTIALSLIAGFASLHV